MGLRNPDNIGFVVLGEQLGSVRVRQITVCDAESRCGFRQRFAGQKPCPAHAPSIHPCDRFAQRFPRTLFQRPGANEMALEQLLQLVVRRVVGQWQRGAQRTQRVEYWRFERRFKLLCCADSVESVSVLNRKVLASDAFFVAQRDDTLFESASIQRVDRSLKPIETLCQLEFELFFVFGVGFLLTIRHSRKHRWSSLEQPRTLASKVGQICRLSRRGRHRAARGCSCGRSMNGPRGTY
mmetsp:Transcript_1293/g.4223  ORF Transcript_1293/g.4223 Transcript_1293/m.4223 type:complete len:238 (-) Transcript_1293:538-1251(-)